MPKVRLTLTSDGRTLTTTGPIFLEPVKPADKPVIEWVAVTSGKRNAVTLPKNLDPGTYKYRFFFSQYEGSSEFTLEAHPGGESQTFETKYNGLRVFRFEVW